MVTSIDRFLELQAGAMSIQHEYPANYFCYEAWLRLANDFELGQVSLHRSINRFGQGNDNFLQQIATNVKRNVHACTFREIQEVTLNFWKFLPLLIKSLFAHL